MATRPPIFGLVSSSGRTSSQAATEGISAQTTASPDPDAIQRAVQLSDQECLLRCLCTTSDTTHTSVQGITGEFVSFWDSFTLQR